MNTQPDTATRQSKNWTPEIQSILDAPIPGKALMDQQPAHSPLPWDQHQDWCGLVSAEDGTVITRNDIKPQDAQLIVRAVNHADKLAEALREATDALFNETYHDPRTGKSDSPWIASVKSKARSALAAYEKDGGQ